MKTQSQLVRGKPLTNLRSRIRLFMSSFLVVSAGHSQDSMESEPKGLRFAGTLTVNSNGISPVPAFSLDKPAITGTFSFSRKRLSFDPEVAFSTKGDPWFINPRFTYKCIDTKKFDLGIGIIYSLSYSYPEGMQGGILRSTQKVAHYGLLQLSANHQISEKTSLGITTYHGHGFGSAGIQYGNFLIFGGNIKELQITNTLFYNFFPQLTYINLDWETEGLFASNTLEVRHKNWPFFLSTQVSQPLVTNISPVPGFKWNVGLSYNF